MPGRRLRGSTGARRGSRVSPSAAARCGRLRWPAARRAAHVDAQVAQALAARELTSRDFAPLPVLGVPGWCADNADPSFYDDPAVFRRGRRTSRL